MKTSITRFLIAISAAGVMSAGAQTTTNLIFGTDFEGNGNLNTVGGYTYAGGDLGFSATSVYGGGVTAGVGVTNSAAIDALPDFTLTGSDPIYTNSGQYTYSGTDIQLQFVGPLNALTPTLNLSSYFLTFDGKVEGLRPDSTSATVFFSTDLNNPFNFDITTNGVRWLRFSGGSFVLTSNFVSYTNSLASLTPISGDLNELTNSAILATVDGLLVDIRCTDEAGTLLVDRSPIWGFDNDNHMIIDNFNFWQIGNPPPLPPKYEKFLWQVDFDANQPGNTYSIIFRDTANTATATMFTNATAGVGGTAAGEVTADISSWSSSPPTGYSGYGSGVSHGIPNTLTNTSKNGYRVYWTAKGGGFLDGVTEASGNASIEFLSAGTLRLELVKNLTLSSNYTSFVIDGSTCDVGIYQSPPGSLAEFAQNISAIDQIDVRYQFNGAPDMGTVVGYDADNTVTVDNIRVVEIVDGIPPLSITSTNSQINVYWADPNISGTAKLQSSTNAAGPYLDVSGASSGAASPYVVPAGSPRLFFRSQWVP